MKRVGLPSRIEAWRGAALGTLWAEALIGLFWPPLAIAACVCGLALLGLLPAGGVAPLLTVSVVLAAMAAVLLRAWMHYATPDSEAAERRLEHDSGLSHRPFAVLRDRSAWHGRTADTLWALHRHRAERAVSRLRLRAPSPGLTIRDPYALRSAALLILIAGLVVGRDTAWQRLRAAFLPSLAPAAPAMIQAWIEPPPYTGVAASFLPRTGGEVEVPAGSKLTMSVTGGSLAPSLEASDGGGFKALSAHSWQATLILRRSGRVRVSWLTGHTGWTVAVTPNDPPVVSWPSAPGRAGRTLETRFPWHVAQRWGVASLHAELRPEGHPDLPSVQVPLALPGTPHDATGAGQADLSPNPYAGVKMQAWLVARDVSGQTGGSGTVSFTLPARNFHNGLARAIADLRRRLALHEETPREAADDIAALALAPSNFNGHSGLYLNLAAAGALLREDGTEAGIAEAQARLWTVALALDGALPEPSQVALERAQANMRRALQEYARGKISSAQLAQAMDALRRALAQRLQDLARKAMKEGKLAPFDLRAHPMTVPSLDRMIKQMEQAAREGRTDEAQQRMAALEDMLRRLNNARIMSPQEAEAARQAQQQAKQQSGAVKDLTQREAGLMDHGQARAPRPAPSREWGEEPPPPDPDKMEADEESRRTDATTQRALHQALHALKQQFQAAGGKIPKSLDDASGDMDGAASALSEGQDFRARQKEGEAVADLSRGAQDMARQMSGSGASGQLALMPGNGDPGPGEDEDAFGGGGDQEGPDRDPLGRPLHQGVGGRNADDSSVRVPDQMEAGRSRTIQEELRRRDADRQRPQDERDYIERLLRAY